MHQQISYGTLDAPSWRLIRNAKLAARMYAPLGTQMSLGDYVRIVRTFLEAFKLAEAPRPEKSSDGEGSLSDTSESLDERIVRLGKGLQVCSRISRFREVLMVARLVLPRSACTMGYQGRPNPPASCTPHYSLPNGCAVHLVDVPLQHMYPWPHVVDPNIRDNLHRRQEVQAHRADLGHLG